jgi:hypothetical protein
MDWKTGIQLLVEAKKKKCPLRRRVQNGSEALTALSFGIAART